MCVQKLDFAAVADASRAEEEDIDLDRNSGSYYGSSHGAASSSDHSALLEAQNVLAQEMLAEAEAEAKVARCKVEVARVTVARAAHKDSSEASRRSRTRIELSHVAPESPVDRRSYPTANTSSAGGNSHSSVSCR